MWGLCVRTLGESGPLSLNLKRRVDDAEPPKTGGPGFVEEDYGGWTEVPQGLGWVPRGTGSPVLPRPTLNSDPTDTPTPAPHGKRCDSLVPRSFDKDRNRVRRTRKVHNRFRRGHRRWWGDSRHFSSRTKTNFKGVSGPPVPTPYSRR